MSPSAIGRPCQTAAAAASEERYNGRRDAGWSSQVARRAHNPEVAGSNPAPATTKALLSGAFCLQIRRDERDFIPRFIPIAEVRSTEKRAFSDAAVVAAGDEPQICVLLLDASRAVVEETDARAAPPTTKVG